MIELVRGPDAPSRMLSYVGGGVGKPCEVVESLFFGGVNTMIVIRNEIDPVGGWIMEQVNAVTDHKPAFGITPIATSHVLVGADSDDTRTHNRAFVRNISFVPK